MCSARPIAALLTMAGTQNPLRPWTDRKRSKMQRRPKGVSLELKNEGDCDTC